MRPQNPQFLTARKLHLGCPILTGFLSGGIPCASITELAGESGVGKTQLCLQLCLSTATTSSSSIYIHSEFPFPIRRLYSLSLPSPSSLDRVLVRPVHSADDLLAVLDRLPSLLRSHSPPVKLLIVDSIAALFRSDFDNNAKDMRKRSGLFFGISGKLKEVAATFGIAVVVTNQVVDVGGGGEEVRVGNYDALLSDGRRVSPALGLSWASCVNMRLFLARMGEEEGGRLRRKMMVVFSPHLPEGSCDFLIDKNGVFGVSFLLLSGEQTQLTRNIRQDDCCGHQWSVVV